MNETQNKLNGVERDMTKEEYKTYDAYLDIKIGAKSAFCSFEKQLELYEQLWEMPSLSTDTKIECLNEAVKLVKKQYGKKNGIPLSARPPLSENICEPLVAI